MTQTKTTIRVTTAPGTNASRIGEAYGSIEGVAWRDAVDRCDDAGTGRVFLECDDAATAEIVTAEMDADDRVTEYEVLD